MISWRVAIFLYGILVLLGCTSTQPLAPHSQLSRPTTLVRAITATPLPVAPSHTPTPQPTVTISPPSVASGCPKPWVSDHDFPAVGLSTATWQRYANRSAGF